MNLVPMGSRVVIAPKGVEDQSKGGVFIPDTAKDHMKPQEGVVKAVGPGRVLESGMRWPVDASIAIGSTVIYTKYAGSEVHLDGERYLIVDERDILTGVKEGAAIESVSTEQPRKGAEPESLRSLMAAHKGQTAG